MGTRERRQRDFEARERRFLDTARALIHEEGLLNLQMARIAEKSEYAVGTLYQHFASKEDLLLAITRQDLRQHVELFEKVRDWGASTRDRIFALAVADMIFVRQNPEHFRIAQYAFCEVVWRAASPECRAAILQAQEPIGAAVVSIIDDAIAGGDLVPQGLSPEGVAIGIWSLTEGMHKLVHAEGVMGDVSANSDPYRLMCRYLQLYLNGLGWKPLVTSWDDASLDALIGRICEGVFHDCSEA
jgi:AcrR family transcriptional regulator